jgi:hypothetical protein
MASIPLLVLLVIPLLLHLLHAGWGPGHHIEFSERIWRRRRETLPRDVAQLLTEEKASYYYGSLAADIINFKAYGGDYNHCHRWSIIDEMRELSRTPRQEAFVLGYLSHLAADTIAHNHFVPYHLARYARTKGLGHLYWEMSADRFVKDANWDLVAWLKSDSDLGELDDLVNRTVPRKALSMRTNKLIFNHVLLVSQREKWRNGMAKLHPIENVSLSRGFLGTFQQAAVDRVRLALHPRGFREIQSVDPNGKQAQRDALSLRKRIIHRLAPGRLNLRESEALASPFLLGMQSPPPRPVALAVPSAEVG